MENQENKGLMAFYYEGYQVRKLDLDGEVWFVGKDAAEALGYEKFNSHLLDKVPEEWKGMKPIHTPGGIQDMLCLSEQGLYFFLGRSDKPAALPFQKWLAGEVVPAIRKQGFYAPPELMEWFEQYKNLPEQYEKFRGQTIEAVKGLKAEFKELKAHADKAYINVLDHATATATAEVKEYLLASHKPSALEAQLADLKRYLSLTIVATGDRRHKIDRFRLYPGYAAKVANPMPIDAFAAHVLQLYPDIKYRGDVFIGCRFDY
jgi:prophage antirepressor-like protein